MSSPNAPRLQHSSLARTQETHGHLDWCPAEPIENLVETVLLLPQVGVGGEKKQQHIFEIILSTGPDMANTDSSNFSCIGCMGFKNSVVFFRV